MRAVFKNELDAYFNSLVGYAFGAFLLLFAGIYTMVYNLKSGLTNFEYVPGNMAFVFLILVPILTMRVLSEERRQHTDQLLYSLPLSMTQVVLGKFLAMLVMLAIPTVIMGMYPLVLRQFGNVYLPLSFGAVAGFFFLGTALLSIGMFISSLTENQALSAGICFVVMLLTYFMSTLSNYVSDTAIASAIAFAVIIAVLALIVQLMTRNKTISVSVGLVLEGILLVVYLFKSTLFEGLFTDAMTELSLFERFYSIVNGVFDLTTIVYDLSVTALFLFLSVQSMEKRRWS